MAWCASRQFCTNKASIDLISTRSMNDRDRFFRTKRWKPWCDSFQISQIHSVIQRHHFVILQIYIWLNALLYPTQRVAEGIMFLTRPSVSPVFLVSATPLKPLDRISWHFVVIKDMLWRMCISTWNFDSIFFSWSYALFELRNLAKMKDTTEHSLSAQLLWNRSTELPETL